ncbi:MAG: hypothetical protein IKQ15_06465 [Kiritimatiellae bacterium]|nr:hypothetical protein [Kiritimatiellia bacterium]
MNQEPIFPPGYLNALSRDCFGPSWARPRAPAAILLQAVGSLALFTGALAAHLAWYGGNRILSRLRRHVSPPEPVPPAAPQPPVSLRGTPTPEDIEDAWDIDPRTLCGRLRIGSRLADLEPTLDSRFLFKKVRNGSKRICARQPGLKGWMKKKVPSVKYSTAMHYKKLATRLRQLIGLDARIPLEWLLPDNEEDLSSLLPADRKNADAAKARLDRLLAENPKVTHLTRAVESKLGIMRMVTIRHIQPPEAGRGRRRKRKENPMNPLISRAVHAGVAVTADEVRTRAFWDAIRKVLGEPEPDAETRRLQSDIRAWLNAPLEARRNRVR